jgi:hypothetical protein
LIVNNISNMMMMAKQVYKVVVMLTPPMLVIILLAKLVAVVMEVVVVAVLGAVEAVDLLPNVCVVNVMIPILHNQSTMMRMGWANQNSPCPNSWVLLMLKSISIGS